MHVYALPMRTRFRGLTVREGVLVEGPAGWGEFAPFDDYDVARARPWWRATLEASTTGWPEALRHSVPVNCTVPAVDPESAAALVDGSHGCRTAKVKVAERGQTLDDDVARVAAVRTALGAGGRIRVDANGGWDVETALAALRRLDRAAHGLEYAEQPCASVEELAAVRRRTSIPIAADESIRLAADPYRVAALDAADVVVLKVAPLGGVSACLEIAHRIGLPVVVSSALESSVGLAAGVALAAALPELPYACGLGTASLFAHDVTDSPLLPVDGELPVRRVAPDADALATAVTDEAAARRWAARVEAVQASGQDGSP